MYSSLFVTHLRVEEQSLNNYCGGVILISHDGEFDEVKNIKTWDRYLKNNHQTTSKTPPSPSRQGERFKSNSLFSICFVRHQHKPLQRTKPKTTNQPHPDVKKPLLNRSFIKRKEKGS
ncbi:hypothetical protein [Enterovibrio paralichthyis]|uniref:hypothetical protein n=1 Tax=Enterovibrio paralichthyis TaxID=2853805 RepID=UPI001C477B3F|nr:hypothetical protein [Enterovibrio paralichthyis]MBV7300319.1 hypothetical protein [Enterovibrio paralichthyis]